MSNEEKKRRSDYIKRRNRWITLQIIMILLFSLATGIFSVVYYQLNKTYYINYNEESTIDYRVYLKENDFFEDAYLGKDQVYVASLIKEVIADFQYEIQMDAVDVEYELRYSLDAELRVVDDKTNVAIFNPTYQIKEEETITKNSNRLVKINEKVEIDYNEYNDLATRFINTYELENVNSFLTIRMHLLVISVCEDIENNTRNEYVMSLNIPLTNKTVNINMTSSVPEEETKILACDRATNKDLYEVLAISFGLVDLLLIIIFIVYVFKTRNTDINYRVKVKKIVNNYRSYIQEIKNEFDVEGYQVLSIKTFNEMLDIRDTIQSPILMNENMDRTCTKFVIPTDTKLLYVFEIKIDDFNEIYGIEE